MLKCYPSTERERACFVSTDNFTVEYRTCTVKLFFSKLYLAATAGCSLLSNSKFLRNSFSKDLDCSHFSQTLSATRLCAWVSISGLHFPAVTPINITVTSYSIQFNPIPLL